jgi:hypothetical protein
MNNKKNLHIGRKVLYALVIFMSGLIIFLNVAGIIGVWTVGRMISNATVAVLKVVENTANTIQESTAKMDARLVTFQEKVNEIMEATQKLSGNVSDKGLIMVLLPEEQEQQLTDKAGSVRDSLNTIKESLSTAVELYRSVDEMPFINLPTLDKDQREQLDQALDQTQSQTGTLRSEIADFRSGVTEKVDKVEAAANKLNERIQNARDRVAKLDAKMAALKAFSIRAQHDIPIIFNTIFVILSLLFAFVIWTQVEMIRNYTARWRLLGQGEETATPPVETPALPVAVVPPVLTVAPPELPAGKPAKPAKPAKVVKKAKPAKPAKAVKKAKSSKPANK